jgi:hypothetical protein
VAPFLHQRWIQCIQYNDALWRDFRRAEISDVRLDVKRVKASHEKVFIHVEDPAFKMYPPTMMSNSSPVVLSILCGVDGGERRLQVSHVQFSRSTLLPNTPVSARAVASCNHHHSPSPLNFAFRTRVLTHKLFELFFLDKQGVPLHFDNPKNCPRGGGTRIRNKSEVATRVASCFTSSIMTCTSLRSSSESSEYSKYGATVEPRLKLGTRCVRLMIRLSPGQPTRLHLLPPSFRPLKEPFRAQLTVNLYGHREVLCVSSWAVSWCGLGLRQPLANISS